MGHTMRSRVVILSAFFTPYRSGAEACAEEVAARLQNEFEIVIVTSRISSKLPKNDIVRGINVMRLGFGTKLDPWLFPFLAPFAVRRLKPRITHAILESFAGLALAFCAIWAPKSKRILTLQSTNTSLLLAPMHWTAHVITAISSVLVRRAARFGRSDVIRIPNGISLDELQSSREQFAKESGRILFVGRMEPMKGIDTLLRAFAEAAKDPDFPANAHIHLVGDGSQAEPMRALAKELDVHDRTEFLGRLTDGRLHREFSEAEIFAGLSRSEALGNVFLEAQASGCAVLATNTGGIPDIVHDGKTGLLVPPNDISAAAESLFRLLTDAPLRDHLTNAAKENVLRYDWDLIAPKYAEVYNKLL